MKMQVQKVQNQNRQIKFEAITKTKDADKLIKTIFPETDIIQEALSSKTIKIIPKKGHLKIKYVPLSKLVQELETDYNKNFYIGVNQKRSDRLKFKILNQNDEFDKHSNITTDFLVTNLTPRRLVRIITKMYHNFKTMYIHSSSMIKINDFFMND